MKNAISTYKFSLYGTLCLFIAVSMLFALPVSANLTDGLVLHHTYDEGKAQPLRIQVGTVTMARFPIRIGILENSVVPFALVVKAAMPMLLLKARMR